MKYVIALYLLFTSIVTAGSLGREEISRNTFEGTWPFTVEQGTLTCLYMGNSQAVILDVDDIWYALNGVATSYGKKSGFVPVEPIWLKDKKLSTSEITIRINIGDAIKHGLTLCQ